MGHTPAMLRGQYLVPGLEDEYMKDGTVVKDLSKKSSLEKDAGFLRWLRGLVSKATTVKAVYDWGVEQLEGAPSSLGGFSPLGYVYLVRNTWYSTLGDGFSVERHSNERSAISAVRFQEARTAKKSPSEKEDEAIEDMVKPKPKKKPGICPSITSGSQVIGKRHIQESFLMTTVRFIGGGLKTSKTSLHRQRPHPLHHLTGLSRM